MDPITVYTTTWCGSCKRLKSQLQREGIPFTEVDVEKNDEAATFVLTANNGALLVPTVKMPDGSALGNPAVSVIKARLAA